jgi:hypothetical protein
MLLQNVTKPISQPTELNTEEVGGMFLRKIVIRPRNYTEDRNLINDRRESLEMCICSCHWQLKQSISARGDGYFNR